MKGHGSHWETLYEDVRAFVANDLYRLIKTLPPHWQCPIERTDMRSIDGGLVDLVIAQAEEAGVLRHQTLLTAGPDPDSSMLFSGYQLVTEGAPYEIRVSSAVPWEFGIEGQVKAAVDGASLNFFDPAFVVNKGHYKAGARLTVQFAALAYHLGPAETFTWDVEELSPDLAKEMRGSGSESDEPVTITTEGAAIMLPMDGWDIDDFSFQARIKSLDYVAFANRTITRLSLAPMVPEDVAFEIPLFVAPHNIEAGYQPKVGDDVSGSFWLTGTLLQTEASGGKPMRRRRRRWPWTRP